MAGPPNYGIMVSLPVLTQEDIEVLKDAFIGDNVTPSIIKALCSSKSPADMHQVGRPKVVYSPNQNASKQLSNF